MSTLSVNPENRTSTLSGLEVHQGEVLLRTVATAMIALADLTDVASFSLPYPAEAQRALDRTVLNCLERGAQPPQSVIDLVRWCRDRPVVDWPIELPNDMFTESDHILDRESGQPTQLCQELAVRSRDSGSEQYDAAVIHAAMQLCRRAEAPASYVRFRRLLVEHPTLTAEQFFNFKTDLLLDPVHELLDQIYEPAPAGYLSAGAYHPCGRCGILLVPLPPSNRWWCELDTCRQRGGVAPRASLGADSVGELRLLARPLRQFVTGPGRAEVELERQLSALHLTSGSTAHSDGCTGCLRIEMWPDFDAYDLRVTFPDGHVWGIDVKDWASPVLLGHRARPLPTTPVHDEGFWVVPRHRTELRPGYVDTFYRHRSSAAPGLQLRTDSTVVRLARQRLEETSGGGAGA